MHYIVRATIVLLAAVAAIVPPTLASNRERTTSGGKPVTWLDRISAALPSLSGAPSLATVIKNIYSTVKIANPADPPFPTATPGFRCEVRDTPDYKYLRCVLQTEPSYELIQKTVAELGRLGVPVNAAAYTSGGKAYKYEGGAWLPKTAEEYGMAPEALQQTSAAIGYYLNRPDFKMLAFLYGVV